MTANTTKKVVKPGASDVMPTSGNAIASEPTNSPTNTDFLICLREACRVSLQVLPVPGVELTTSDGYGQMPSESCASYDPDSASLRTPQQSLLLKAVEPSTELQVDWSNAGMICGGKCYPLLPLVRGIGGNVSGYLLPTPIARDWKDTPGMAKTGSGREANRKRDDTLPRRIYRLEESLPKSGIVNPAFSLWLMGFPDGWLEND